MKIIYCIAATYRSGGMERVLANKANWLADHGHEVTIVTTDQQGRPPCFELHPSIATVDLDINYEANNGAGFITKLLQYPIKQRRHRRRLRQVLAEISPDITVSMGDNEAPIVPRLKEGGRKVLEVHFSRFKRLQYNRRGLWALADRWRSHQDLLRARRYDRFVVLTAEDARYWTGVPRIAVVPNAIGFDPIKADPASSRTVLAVGRLTYQKGFDRLIHAWAKASADLPDWRLEIVGSGELLCELQQLADSLDVSHSVTFTSHCADMPCKYSRAAMLAMTSRYEGLPMALIEAQSSGLPIVVMDCKCGPHDVVTDGVDGFITAPDDIDATADRLRQLMQSDSLRTEMGRRGLEASRRYRPEAIMRRWADIFTSLCNTL
ncbi:MAG: glycosyltransferase family 4 protein [Bacteroides sp.]|nr:glycosyltransferase family 4 protein [Bacteroides sp.]MCM1413245.1 glycosyltransferase family 4 protein [Bacteroides sp.]MCM1471445.1 glycosyltransferase family 4 protein [Bacteroides sp.]